MKIIITLLLSFFAICTMAQPLQVEWIKSIPGSQFEQNSSLAQAPCGDLYVVGFFQEYFGTMTSVAGEDGFIAKYNDEGQLLWTKQLAGTSTDRVNGVVVADDNQIYIVGEFKEKVYYNNDSLVSQGELDVLLAKIDSSGTIQWAISGGGTGYESGNAISLSANGNLCITGYYETNLAFDTSTSIQGVGLRDIFVATFDQSGSLQWLQNLGGPAFEDGRSIHTDNADNIYITGSYRDILYLPNDTLLSNGSHDAYVAKFNGSGQFQWAKGMGGPAADEGSYINVDNQQNIYAVGWYDRVMYVDSTTLDGAKEEDAYVVKLDSNGNLLWSESLGGNFDERAYAIDFDAADNSINCFLVLQKFIQRFHISLEMLIIIQRSVLLI